MNKIIDLPIIINGKVKYINENTSVVTLKYQSDIILRFPKITKEEISQIANATNKSLTDLSITEIIYFMEKFGLFLKDNCELKNKAAELSAKITGYDKSIILRDYSIIADYCATRSEFFDQIDSELGSYTVLDEWFPKQDCLVKAIPRGKVLHYLVGNVPIAGLYTILRSIVTKNLTIAKLASRDPISSLFFMLAFIEFAPEHPITKSISALYWKGGDSEIENPMLNLANVVCVWGGTKVVSELKPKIPYRTEYIEFGPKRSVCILDLKQINNVDNAAARLATDISLYNQEACFSPLIAYFVGEITDEFLERLKYWLKINEHRLPKGTSSFDDNVHIRRTKLEEIMKGNQVIEGHRNKWTIIIRNKLEEIENHPLGRTIYLFTIKSVEEILPYISESIQSIGVLPWEIGNQNKDMLAETGADRICELGSHTVFRTGFSHDSMYALSRMVRWMNLDRSLSYKGKFNEDEKAIAELYYGYHQQLIDDKYKDLSYN